MSTTRRELIEECEKNIEKGYSKLKEIYDIIEDADEKGGIEMSCQTQDRYSRDIDRWLHHIEFFEEQLEGLKTRTME